jgi:DNA-binding response OmpR family regulator
MSGDEKRPLGKILLQRKLVSQEQLDQALREQKAHKDAGEMAPIASILVEDGAVKEVEALRALSEQYGVPGIDLAQIAVVLETLDVVPREVAVSHRILPLLIRGERLFLAMGDPQDKHVVDEIEFVTGKKVYPYVAMQTTLVKVIGEAYDARERGEKHYLGPRVPAETLRQLGLDPSAPPPTPSRRERESGPPMQSVVVEEAVMEMAEADVVSTRDFGNIPQEVSSVANLPDDLRDRTTQATQAMTSGAGKLVLVVDDEEEIRKLLRRLLTQKGYRVVEADRGLLALRLVKEHVPDLIILDAMLPELHGFDIARRIKGSEKYGHIPVIMVSAVYRGWRIAEDLKSNYGVEAYIEKPFRIAEVLETVGRLVAAGDAAQAEPARDPEYLSAEAEKALNDGIAAYKGGDLDTAIAHLKRGVQIDPLAYRLHFHLALLHGKKGDIYEGIQELERAIDLNPKHFPALKNLAVLYEKAGFKNKAVEMWERCAGVAPDEATSASIKAHLVKLL